MQSDDLLWRISVVMRSGQVITVVCDEAEKFRLIKAVNEGFEGMIQVNSYDGGCALLLGSDISAITCASVDAL